MPQTYIAGSIFLAAAALEEQNIDDLVLSTRLSDLQLARVRKAMQATHRLRRIPAGNHRFLSAAQSNGQFDMSQAITIDDSRLLYIWNQFRLRAVALAQNLAARSEGASIAIQLRDAFHSGECRALLRRFRDQYDRRRHCSETEAARLRRAIVIMVVERVEPRFDADELLSLVGP